MDKGLRLTVISLLVGRLPDEMMAAPLAPE
jgi:hypothetical protein